MSFDPPAVNRRPRPDGAQTAPNASQELTTAPTIRFLPATKGRRPVRAAILLAAPDYNEKRPGGAVAPEHSFAGSV